MISWFDDFVISWDLPKYLSVNHICGPVISVYLREKVFAVTLSSICRKSERSICRFGVNRICGSRQFVEFELHRCLCQPDHWSCTCPGLPAQCNYNAMHCNKVQYIIIYMKEGRWVHNTCDFHWQDLYALKCHDFRHHGGPNPGPKYNPLFFHCS